MQQMQMQLQQQQQVPMPRQQQEEQMLMQQMQQQVGSGSGSGHGSGRAGPSWQPAEHAMLPEEEMAAGYRWDKEAVLEQQRRMRLEAEQSPPPVEHVFGTQAELKARRRADRCAVSVEPSMAPAGTYVAPNPHSPPKSPHSPHPRSPHTPHSPHSPSWSLPPKSPSSYSDWGASQSGAEVDYGSQEALRARRRAARAPPDAMRMGVPSSPQSAMMASQSPARESVPNPQGSQEALKARRAAARMPVGIM